MQIYDLRCEYLNNPLGLDCLSPRLFWKMQNERRGARQSAYQIMAASSPDNLKKGNFDLWDTGKVQNDISTHIPYQGKPLSSGVQVWWTVRVWDEQGNTAEPSPAFFEMGLLSREEWQGEWIGSMLAGANRTSIPAPYLRKDFAVTRPLAKARLFATALGLYEAHLNGKQVGDDVFTPGWTDYKKRVQYQVYDVTEQLVQGANVLGAILGDGWYCGCVEWRGRQRWGDRPRFLSQLALTYTDGTEEIITTDDTWKVSFGPILANDMQQGESYDARQELTGWDSAGYDDSDWLEALVFDDPEIELNGMRGPTVKQTQELTPVVVREISSDRTRWFVDMGQNMVGRLRLKLNARPGIVLCIRHSEILDQNGSLYFTNLRTAAQTDYYTCSGADEEIWEPRFTFHGFRYAEITIYDINNGEPLKLTPENITGVVVHSDTPTTGHFSCSNEMINQLQSNIDWGQRGNFVDVPTDCPQRDERMGWTGDAQVFVRTAAFNRDVAGFFTKWTRDLEDAQADSGAYPPVATETSLLGESDGGPAWADAGVICPWTIWLCYGDKQILAERWDSMVRFMDFLARTSPDLVRCNPEHTGWGGFGDWLSINADTRTDLIGTAYHAYSANLMSQIAGVLGKTEDQIKYARLFAEIRQVFVRRFISQDGLMVSQSQTACVLALGFDLAPHEMRGTIVKQLVRDIEGRGMKLSTGFVGSSYLNPVLTSMGRDDIAAKLLYQTQWPSWLYAVTQGATTIWERWDGWTKEKGFQDAGMNSFNHYAYGAIGSWLYQVVAGIDADPSAPGYRRSFLRPHLIEGLTHAEASLNTLYGVLASAWKLNETGYTWNITVPANTTATLWIPTGDVANITENGAAVSSVSGLSYQRMENYTAIFQAEAGTYSFAVKK